MFKGSLVSFNFINISLIGPKDGWNIQAHRKPERIKGTAHGIITSDLKNVEPFTILFRQKAKIRLVTTVKPVEPKANIKVRVKIKGKAESPKTLS